MKKNRLREYFPEQWQAYLCRDAFNKLPKWFDLPKECQPPQPSQEMVDAEITKLVVADIIHRDRLRCQRRAAKKKGGANG